MAAVVSTVLDRDIDLVLITGAGASRAFGVNATQLPLMGDWSESLTLALREISPHYETATGLKLRMTAEEFEAQLGRFLRSVQAFKSIGNLLAPLSSIQPNQSPAINADAWQQWHHAAAFHLDEIIDVIHRSLYDMFAAPRMDEALPQQAYGALFRLLGVTPPEHPDARWVYATTNYDLIGELAIHLNGGLPDFGEVTFNPGSPERQLKVDNLLGGMPRHVPVLHLHGRVGWFQRDGAAYSTQVTKYERASGTPIIMLPDLDKVYENVGIISPLWQQFEEALSRARRVFVLGHSLNDRALVRALRANVEPMERVAVTFLQSRPGAEDTADEAAAAVRARVQSELPGASAVPIRFEAGVSLETDALEDWFRGVNSIGSDY
jgi:SIR2-like domain